MPTRRTKTTAWRTAGRLAAVVGLGLLSPLGGAWAGDLLFPSQAQSDGAARPDEARLQEQRAEAARALQVAASQAFLELQARLDPPSPEGLVLLEDWLSRYRGASVTLQGQDHPVDVREVALAEEALRDLTAALAAPAAPKQAARAAPQAETAANRADLEAYATSNLLRGLIGTRGDSSGQVADVFGDSDATLADLESALSAVDELSGDGGEVQEGATRPSARTRPSPSVQGQVEIGSIDNAGGEDTEAIRQTLKKYRGQLKACYEQRLKELPTLEGRIAVDIDITSGRVTQVMVNENSTVDAALATCVSRRIKGWRFDSGTTDSVYTPFLFTAD